MRLLEWSLWLYTAYLFAGSGPTGAELGLPHVRSIDGVAAAVHAAPIDPAQAGVARAVHGWSGARVSAGSVLHTVRFSLQASWLLTARPASPVAPPDVARIALGFLADHSLAPPDLG